MRNRILFLLCFLLVGLQAFAQVAVSGKVIDAQGLEMPGVNVAVKGAAVGTMTGSDGRFTLSSIPGGSKAVLQFSFIGYKTQEVQLGNQRVLNITLAEDVEKLEEVVVVAYGTQKKKDLTGSLTQVDSKVIGVQSVSTVSKALEGAIPGLQVASADGQPGIDMGIRVRGVSSASGGGTALVVIDGVPAQNDNPLSNMNAKDIASVTVLKDAASTALYGSRASNGVVLITTKRGASGKAKISFDGRWGWNSIGPFNVNRIDDAASYYQYAWQSIYNSYRYGVNGTGHPGSNASGNPYTNIANPNHTDAEAREFASQHLFNYVNNETKFQRNGLGNWMAYKVPGAIYTKDDGVGVKQSSTMSGAYLINPDGSLNPAAQYLYGDNDTYANQLLQTNFRQEYNVSASGGSEKIDYFASLGYLKDPSYVRTSNFERYAGRTALNARLFDWLKIGTNISYTHSITDAMSTKWGRNPGSATGNVMKYVNGSAPTMSIFSQDENGGYVYNADGSKKEAALEGGTYSPFGSTCQNTVGGNILQQMDNNINKTTVDQWTSRVYADVKFLKDFTFTVNFNLDQYNYKLMKYRTSLSGLGSGVGGLGINNYQQRIINTQQLLNYNKDMGKHHIDALGGHEYNDLYRESMNWGSAYELIPGYISPGNFTSRYVNVSTLATPGWSLDKYRMESYFGRANYIYNDKYYLSGSLRADGSSKFMKNKWGTFWSVGGGWRISSESFMKQFSGWLDNAKIRASYGVIGDQSNISGYYTNHTWSYGVSTWNQVSNGTGTAKDYSIGYGGLVNEELTWETAHTLDAGLDFSLFNSRITGTIDVYNRETVNSFYNEPVSYLANAGAQTRQRNSAKLRNRGFELELAGDIVRTKDWTVNLSLNGTHYTTELVSVPSSTIPAWTETSDLPKGTWMANGEGWSSTGAGNTSFTFYLRGEGKPWYNMYLYKYAGVDQTSGLPMYWHRVTADDVKKGNYSGYKQGESVKTTKNSDASFYEVGDALPKWIGGFTTSVRYKDFDFQAIIAYQLGGKFFSTEYANGLYRSNEMDVSNMEAPSKDLIGNTWSPENTGAKFPIQWWNTSYYDGATFGSWKYTDMSLFSASYMRVKNITLGYTLPNKYLQKAYISKMRVYASADNLIFLSAKKGVDPSMALTGGFNVGQYIYPTMQTISLGVSLDF